MTTQMLLCPSCRARVLEDWVSCKFCGESLATDLVPVNVDPDHLGTTAEPTILEVSGSAPDTAPPPPTDTYNWSQWVNDPVPETLPPPPMGDEERALGGRDASDGSSLAAVPLPPPPPHDVSGGDLPWASTMPTDGAPPTDASTWAAGSADAEPLASPPFDPAQTDYAGTAPPPPTAPGSDAPGAHFGEPSTEHWVPETGSEASHALEPHPSESGGIWQSGPAPAASQSFDEAGPSGLDPVSWYEEPTGDSTASFATGPSLFEGDHGRRNRVPDDDSFEPNASPPPPGDSLEKTGPPIEFIPSADGWGDSSDAPSDESRGQALLSREARMAVMGILLIAIIALSAYLINGNDATYPAKWTGNLGQLASTVTKSRELEFKHPVGTVTLSPSEYDKAFNDQRTVTDAKDLQLDADRVASYRALGVVTGDPTLSKPAAMLAHPGDNAFYDLKAHRVVLRSGVATARDNVAVIGALSVALDDQWAKLGSLSSVSPDNQLAAVVAGDAEMARADYLETLPVAERLQVQAAIDASAQAHPPTTFPDILIQMRKVAGHGLVQTVHDVGGHEGVTRLLEFPPTSDNQVSNPTAYFNGTGSLQVPTPQVPANATPIDQGRLGATVWYLVLASRLDPTVSMDTADLWSGDAFVRYRQPDGKVCISAAFRGASSNEAAVMQSTMERWRKALPADQATVELVEGDLVTLNACDPGSGKVTSGRSLAPAMNLFNARSKMAANYYREGTKKPNGPNGPLFTPTEAWCMANHVVHHVTADQLASVVDGRGVFYKTVTIEAGKSCGSTVADILFTPS